MVESSLKYFFLLRLLYSFFPSSIYAFILFHFLIHSISKSHFGILGASKLRVFCFEFYNYPHAVAERVVIVYLSYFVSGMIILVLFFNVLIWFHEGEWLLTLGFFNWEQGLLCLRFCFWIGCLGEFLFLNCLCFDTRFGNFRIWDFDYPVFDHLLWS